MKDLKPFIVILSLVGLVFLRSSLEKIEGGTFVDSLGKVLTGVAKKNPYPWFKSFLESVAIPNSQVFGRLTMWGELLSGIAITFGSLYLIFFNKNQTAGYLVLISGLVGGMFLNLNFYLGFGYTSPATDSLNLLMFFIELIGVVTLLSRRQQHNKQS